MCIDYPQNQDVNLPSAENVVIHHSLIFNLNKFINLHLILINMSSFPMFLFPVKIPFPILQTSLPYIFTILKQHFIFTSQSSPLYVTINTAFSLDSSQPQIQSSFSLFLSGLTTPLPFPFILSGSFPLDSSPSLFLYQELSPQRTLT